MKSRTAIALLAVAAALVVFIFLFERDTMTTGEIEGRRDRVFVEFRRDLVDGLTVKGSSGEEVALSRVGPEEGAGEEWRITAPRDLKADGSEVREILSALDFLLRDRTARGEGAASDARYGLDSPRATGSFSVRGRVTAFRVGADAPGDDVYLALVGVDDEVYAVDGSFLESIDKDLDDLRDKHLLGRALDAATAVAVSRPSGEIALSRGEEGSWRVKREGVWLLAAQDQVRDLLRAVGDVEATEFVADDVGAGDLGEHGLDGPPRRVVVELEGGEIVRLLVGGPCEGVEAAVVAAFAGTGTVACVDDEIVEILDRPSSRLEEARLAALREEDVKRIALEASGRSLEMERGEEGWALAGGEGPDLEQVAVGNLIEAVSETRAESVDVGAGAVAALGDPSATATFEREGVDPVILDIWAGDDPGREIVRRRGEDAALSVPAGLLEKVAPDVLAFRARTISLGDSLDAVELSIRGPATQRLERVEGSWKLVEPLEIEADGGAARRLAELLTEIRAERFVASSAAPEHGLDAPWATVAARLVEGEEAGDGVEDRTGEREIALEIGTETEGGRFARVKGEDGAVFAIGEDYADAVSRPLAARDLLELEAAEIGRVELDASGASAALVREGDRWTAEGLEVDSEKIDRLLADLRALRALRADSFAPAAGQGLDEPALSVKVWKAGAPEGAEPEVRLFGGPSPGEGEKGRFARKPGLDVVFVVPARVPDELIGLVPSTSGTGADAGAP